MSSSAQRGSGFARLGPDYMSSAAPNLARAWFQLLRFMPNDRIRFGAEQGRDGRGTKERGKLRGVEQHQVTRDYLCRVELPIAVDLSSMPDPVKYDIPANHIVAQPVDTDTEPHLADPLTLELLDLGHWTEGIVLEKGERLEDSILISTRKSLQILLETGGERDRETALGHLLA